jgi:hypothetical protein
MHPKRGVIIIVFAAVFIAALVVLVLTRQIVYQWPPCGDPGNKRLNELANDAVFASLPPGTHLIDPLVQTPAEYQQHAFEASGCVGATVVMTFESDQPQATIYQFYAVQAANAGWHAEGKGSYGYTDAWFKTYSDNAGADLNLSIIDNGPNGRRYKLAGSIDAVYFIQ